MKTIKLLITTLLLVATATAVNGQTKETTEITGNKNTYILEEVPGFYNVYNKSNTLMHVTPSYLLYEVTPPITVGNRKELDKIVHTHFAPYFKKYSGSFPNYATFRIALLSDINGAIREMIVVYPTEIGVIPATAIEEFEEAVLKSSVKLDFDKTRIVFQGTAWVGQVALYNPNLLRFYIGDLPKQE